MMVYRILENSMIINISLIHRVIEMVSSSSVEAVLHLIRLDAFIR
jgi:hypothetical protein